MKIPGNIYIYIYDANVYFSEMSVIWGQTKFPETDIISMYRFTDEKLLGQTFLTLQGVNGRTAFSDSITARKYLKGGSATSSCSAIAGLNSNWVLM